LYLCLNIFFILTDATNTFDQARFFQEHAEQVFQVVFETCMHQIEKIKRKEDCIIRDFFALHNTKPLLYNR
jgi:hypothetical protein